ncbi:MAG: hypothetical protein H6624_16290 [Bdellovibrionaceae bacterium]|nr:hypothetical protein [Bdellovibrionales bacterium]MCB9085908.1 hypothetical protein [Pseudobdellovibrionaceae bacterium]
MKRAFDHLIFGVLVISCMSLVVCSLEAYSQQSGQRTEFVSTDGKKKKKKGSGSISNYAERYNQSPGSTGDGSGDVMANEGTNIFAVPVPVFPPGGGTPGGGGGGNGRLSPGYLPTGGTPGTQ